MKTEPTQPMPSDYDDYLAYNKRIVQSRIKYLSNLVYGLLIDLDPEDKGKYRYTKMSVKEAYKMTLSALNALCPLAETEEEEDLVL